MTMSLSVRVNPVIRQDSTVSYLDLAVIQVCQVVKVFRWVETRKTTLPRPRVFSYGQGWPGPSGAPGTPGSSGPPGSAVRIRTSPPRSLIHCYRCRVHQVLGETLVFRDPMAWKASAAKVSDLFAHHQDWKLRCLLFSRCSRWTRYVALEGRRRFFIGRCLLQVTVSVHQSIPFPMVVYEVWILFPKSRCTGKRKLDNRFVSELMWGKVCVFLFCLLIALISLIGFRRSKVWKWTV